MNIEELAVGDHVRFAEEKLKYTIQAKGKRYLVCTKPFNPARTVLYTIVDLEDKRRGPENLVFGIGAETREQCEEMLDRLEGAGMDDGQWFTELSHRRSIPLVVQSVIKAAER